MADAAYAIGNCLGGLETRDISLRCACQLDRPFQFTEPQLADPLLLERFGGAYLLLLQQLFAR
jgi:hypothetical protein